MTLLVWRHPRPIGAAGRCIGLTDVPVDRRKAKRLAHRIRRYARRHGRPRVVWTSQLARAADVGRWLRRWGWQHRIDRRLSELDFGHWDGRAWTGIPQSEVDTWCEAFAVNAAGGGECVAALMARCAAFLEEHRDEPLHIVGHAGWMNSARWVLDAKPAPHLASEWPAAVAYCERLVLAA
jgi:alpha-ribazole phosphatase